MTTVPSNLIPTRITQLPEYQGVSTLGYMPYVIDGVTYKVQFSNIAAVGAVPSTRTITGGGGLTGGGDLSADRVISIAAGGVGFSQLADSGVAAGAYGDSANIPVLTVDIKGRVTVASTTPINLAGYVPTSRSVLAGAGLTGGGTLAADRTISLTLSTATPQSGGTPAAGTATVAAREDHVHPAVDLSDATETSGVLPMSRGGTGSSLSPAAGAILYSSGSSVALSNAGTAEQLFFSQGTAAPIFRSLTGGTTGLTFGVVSSAYVLAGTLAITSGGTNATTVSGARVNLLPSYTGNAGKVLALNSGATDIEWLALTGTGTVTSVNLTAGTGISVSGGPITSSGSITVVNTAPDQVVALTAGTNVSITGTYPSFTINATDQFAGTVTSVSVVSANGLAGTVANATTTPAITLSTSVTGIVKGNGTALSAAVAATDYVAPGAYTTSGLTMATARLLGRTTASTGAAEEITVGTGLTLATGSIVNAAPDQVVSLTGAGTTSISGTYPSFTITSNDAFVGTVTSVGGTGTVSGLTLTGTVTTSGNLTLGGTLAVVPSDFASQTANTFLAAPNGAPGAPTFRAIVAADVPTLNQNTTGTASNVTGTVAVVNGGTGQTTYTDGQILIGNSTGNTLTKTTLTAGTNVSITNGSGAITINATDQFVGTVTSVGGTGTVNGITLTGTVTTSGSLTLGGTLSGVSLTTQVSGTLPVANGGTNGTATPTAGGAAYGTGTAYAFTTAGTAGQVLVSTGATAPAFGGIDGGTF